MKISQPYNKKRASSYRNRGVIDVIPYFFDELAKYSVQLSTPLVKQREVWIQGNHATTGRSQLVDEQPELQGYHRAHTISLELEARKWEIVKTGEAYELGKLLVIHGENTYGFGQHKLQDITQRKQWNLMDVKRVLYGHYSQSPILY